MDVRTLCLGVLTHGDYTGYDIKKFFEKSFTHFFPAGYGSIYPALAQLLDQELVTCTEQAQDKLPDKKIYSLSEAGRDAFVRAIAEGNGSHKLRSEFLVQTFFADLIDDRRMNEIISRRLKDTRKQLDLLSYDVSDNQVSDIPASNGAQFTTGFNLAVLRAAEAYIVENKHMLEASEQGDTRSIHVA